MCSLPSSCIQASVTLRFFLRVTSCFNSCNTSLMQCWYTISVWLLKLSKTSLQRSFLAVTSISIVTVTFSGISNPPPPRTSGDLRCSLSLTTPPRKRTKGVTLQISLSTKWPNVESASLPGRRLVAMADSDGGVCFSCTSVLEFSKNRFLNLFEDVKSTDEVRTKRILDWLSFEVYHILILTKRLQS